MPRGRRRFLQTLALSPFLAQGATAWGFGSSASRDDPLFLGTNVDAAGTYRLTAFSEVGRIRFDVPLPGRGHGFAIHTDRHEVAVFARRPGRFAQIISLEDGRTTANLRLPRNRHFYGHGVYAADGRTLFTTENDILSGQGLIGIWDTAAGYKRLGEMPARGIGPHQVILSPDGKLLIIANGGILTHPDSGRHKLNIPTMDPALVYLDAGTGKLCGRICFKTSRARLLSIRHLAVSAAGVVCLGCQDQGPRSMALPLVGFHRLGDGEIALCEAPPHIARRMRGYTGSVAMDAVGSIAAVSAPRGNLVTFWNVADRSFLGSIDVPDGCGMAAASGPGNFIMSSGTDRVLRANARDFRATAVPLPPMMRRRWDNHLARR